MARPVLASAGRWLLAWGWAAGLVSASPPDERLRLVSADILENIDRNGQAVQVLSGHVIFQKGGMELRTDRAEFFRDQERTHLSGSVEMVRPGERLTSDSLIFYNGEDRIHAWGHVRFVQDDQTILSREFIYWTVLDSGIARRDVIMTQGNRQLTAREFRTMGTDGLRGASFEAFGAVVVDEGSRRITSERMDYDDIRGVLSLTGQAAVRAGDRDLLGERIRMTYDGEQLQSVRVEGGAEATARIQARLSASGDDWRTFTELLTSREMEARFIDDRIGSLQLLGMATSIYHVVEDSVLQGINHVTGDTIIVGFDDSGDLKRLTVRGGARGRFEPEPGNTDVDTVVVYRGEFIDYDIPQRITYLERDARVDYRGNGLAAGKIVVTWENNLLRAESAFDEPPTLHQTGQDPMVGELMEFDLVSERGRVVRGRTKLDNGLYRGELLHRFPNNIYYIRRSIYTTCDLDAPHFYFAASRMKMLQGDKIIAKPVVFYLADVPLLALPFAIFPNKAGGRRTGWIMPGYGESRRDGQYLQGLGYFWAINDYADATTSLDFYTKRGLKAVSRLRYNRRYRFSGTLALTFFKLIDDKDIVNLFSDRSSLKWGASWQHRQTIDPTQHFNVNARYTSSPSLNRNFGTNLRTRLNQQIVSNASYSKNWRSISSSITVALQERYDLQAVERLKTAPRFLGQKIEERSRTIPSIRFSRSNTPLIKAAKGRAPAWYNNIRWSINSSLNNSQSIFWEAQSAIGDSLYWPEEKDREVLNRFSARHNLSLNAQQNLFRYISMNLNFAISEGWVPSHRVAQLDPATGVFVRDTTSGRIEFDEVRAFSARHTGRISLSAQTNIYGMIPLQIGSLTALRHVITPKVSYSYTPDFSKPFLGYDLNYFQEDSAGELFDKFSGSPIGGTSRSEQQAISLSVINLFQAKQEIDGKEYKPTILRWNMSTSYNFAADSLNLAPIRSSFRSPFLDKLNLDISMVHDIYAVNEGNRRINKVLPFPRLASMNASTRLRLAGTRFVPLAEGEEAEPAPEDSLEVEPDELDQIGSRRRVSKPILSQGNLWEAGLGLRYNLQPSLDKDRRETFWLEGDIKAAVGPGWKVRYSVRFNMLTQGLVHHDVQLYRELHCWEFAFNWTPSGPGQGFYLRINVRDLDLRDIKFESRGGRQSVLGGF
ncbi:MAG: hypothetical protein IIC41_02585 [Candidatus Marinimicrobia bacterium]|nr:hypothetical protein [Candidatus Neomarinimicrobiota bacterium]